MNHLFDLRPSTLGIPPAILHLGACRDEAEAKRRRGSDVSAATDTRAQAMAGRETRNGLRRHPDLPRVWVSNPIELRQTGPTDYIVALAI